MMDGANRSNISERGSPMKITTIGIDLAKNSISVHGVDQRGKVVLRKTLNRAKLLELMANVSPCLVGLEACGGAHDLAQSYTLRPLPSQPSHQTTVPHLYMLGAAPWPGHGINGGSGYIVAQKLLAAGGADKT